MQQHLQQNTLNIKYSSPDNEIAKVYVAELEDGSCIEFVESLQPPFSIQEKWVLIISTLKGCPVKCPICDAGSTYKGKLSFNQMLSQIKHMTNNKFPDGKITSKKFKIQFARMGDPAFNSAVLDVMEELPNIYPEANLIPCISTIAPNGCDEFFERLFEVKNSLYSKGMFQMQFSIHTTDEDQRKQLVPAKTWSFKQMAEYGKRFFKDGDRKVTLNFATPKGFKLEPEQIREYFSPAFFIIKLTPVNPTNKSIKSRLQGLIEPDDENLNSKIVSRFNKLGYQTILSIGELTENQIGSNCGMYLNMSKSRSAV